MKKKPHHKKSIIKQEFEDFRSRLVDSNNPNPGVRYELQEHKTGFTVIIHRERGANESLHFDTKAKLDLFLKSI